MWAAFFCYGDEENGHHACMNVHLTTANQSEIRKAYLVSVGGGASNRTALYLSGDLWESNCEKWFGVADMSFSKCSVWSELAVDASGTNSPSMAQWCLFLPSGQKIAGDCQNTKKN